MVNEATVPESGWIIIGETTLSTLYLALLRETDCGRPAGDGYSPIAWSWDNLQAIGLGGRAKMGGGFFEPA